MLQQAEYRKGPSFQMSMGSWFQVFDATAQNSSQLRSRCRRRQGCVHHPLFPVIGMHVRCCPSTSPDNNSTTTTVVMQISICHTEPIQKKIIRWILMIICIISFYLYEQFKIYQCWLAAFICTHNKTHDNNSAF